MQLVILKSNDRHYDLAIYADLHFSVRSLPTDLPCRVMHLENGSEAHLQVMVVYCTATDSKVLDGDYAVPNSCMD